jgi:TPR repeat protein
MDIQELQKTADRGDSEAQFELAGMYASGEGVPQDTHKSVDLLHRAADLGHAKALFILSGMYRFGGSVPKDLQKSDILLKRAADLGFPAARSMLSNKRSEPVAEESHDRIIADRDRTIRSDPSDVDAYLNRGHVYRKERNIDRAVEENVSISSSER